MLFGGKQLFGFDYDDKSEYFYDDPVTGKIVFTQKMMHYTLIFHTFVFLQVFNEINSRKLGEREFNVFSGFFNNWLFLLIIACTMAVQCVLVQYGGISVRTTPLSWE